MNWIEDSEIAQEISPCGEEVTHVESLMAAAVCPQIIESIRVTSGAGVPEAGYTSVSYY